MSVTFRILVIGDKGVGKTTIINNFIYPNNDPQKLNNINTTIGIDVFHRFIFLKPSASEQEETQEQNQEETQEQNQEETQEQNQEQEIPEGIAAAAATAATAAAAATAATAATAAAAATAATAAVICCSQRVKHADADADADDADADAIKLLFWDTAGSSIYTNLVDTYYSDFVGVIIVFDASEHSSYYNIRELIDKVICKNKCPHFHPILIIANKCDKRNIRYSASEISAQLRSHYSKQIIMYCEHSIDYQSSIINHHFNSYFQYIYNNIACAKTVCNGIRGSLKRHDDDKKKVNARKSNCIIC